MTVEVIVYRENSHQIVEGFSLKEIPKLLKEEKSIVWVDLEKPTEAETNLVLSEIFKFHPLSVEDAILTRNQPKVEDFNEYLFFIIHGVKPGETSFTNFVTKELDGFLGKNFLVTYHFEHFRSIENVKRQLRVSPHFCQRGVDYLLHQILDQIVDLYMPLVDEYDDAINQLEDQIFLTKSTGNRLLEEIVDIKRSVARLRRISAKQLEVLYRFTHSDFSLINENNIPFFRDVHDHLQRISDLSDSYRDMVNGLMDIHFSVIANKTNEITRVLAIFSAIMLPLSLIAGIYGMNMKLYGNPEDPNYFWIVMGIMFLIAVGLLIYFWRKGWIREQDLDLPSEKDDSKK